MAAHGKLMMHRLRSTKKTHQQLREGLIQAQSLCVLLTVHLLFFASVSPCTCMANVLYFNFNLCISDPAEHVFYIPWPGTIAATFPGVGHELSFKNVKKNFEDNGIHLQSRNRAIGRDFGIQVPSLEPRPKQ
jgi:hypothetical protein